jgi:hypothetical protein
MARTLKTEREQLEAELIRTDRTLALDRRELAAMQAQVDALVEHRLSLEAKLAKHIQPKATKNKA